MFGLGPGTFDGPDFDEFDSMLDEARKGLEEARLNLMFAEQDMALWLERCQLIQRQRYRQDQYQQN